MRDFQRTERQMRLKVIMEHAKQTEKATFKKKSEYTPITCDSNNLENYLFATKLELAKLKFGTRYNLTTPESAALKA